MKQIGDISGAGIVYFADNGIHVMIVGGGAYKYDIQKEILSSILVSDSNGFMGSADVTLLTLGLCGPFQVRGKFNGRLYLIHQPLA